MNEYFVSVFATSALLGVMSVISFDKGESVRRFAFSILLLYVTLLPLSDISPQDFDFGETVTPEGIGDGEYERVAEEAFASGILRLVTEKYSLREENVRVMVEDFDFASMRAGKIRIILSGSAVFSDYKGIEKYINECNMGECSVEVEIG